MKFLKFAGKTGVKVKIIETEQYGDNLGEALARLIPQLSPTARIPGREDIERIIADTGTHLLAAVDEKSDEIVGILTLVIYDIPTARRAWIEDVVVDAEHRGEHIGLALVDKAIEIARECHANQINLTSNPRRTAARSLYRRCGFTEVETTLFRLKL